jgi:hypothetical protein
VSSAPLPGYPTSELARNRWVSLDLLLSIKRYAFESDPDNILRLDECTAVAALIVEQIEAVAAQGKLELLQDNASCLTSVLIVFLRKVSRRGYRDRLLYFRIPDLDLVAKSVRASGGCRPLNKPTRSHSSSGCLHATKEPPRGTPKLPRRSWRGSSGACSVLWAISPERCRGTLPRLEARRSMSRWTSRTTRSSPSW